MPDRYSQEEIHRALHVLALEAGNYKATERATGIPYKTISKWRNDLYRDSYERIRVQVEDKLSRNLAEEMLELGKQRLGLMRKLANEADEALDSGDHEKVHKLAGADRNLATSAGILTQNSRLLQDKPTELIESRYSIADLDEGLRKLGLLVDSTAVELPALDSPAVEETPAVAEASSSGNY